VQKVEVDLDVVDAFVSKRQNLWRVPFIFLGGADSVDR